MSWKCREFVGSPSGSVGGRLPFSACGSGNHMGLDRMGTLALRVFLGVIDTASAHIPHPCSHRAGSCDCLAVRAMRSPNPTPSARAHLAARLRLGGYSPLLEVSQFSGHKNATRCFIAACYTILPPRNHTRSASPVCFKRIAIFA